MRTSGGNAVANDSGGEGELKCTVAIKEIQVPHANKRYSFSTHLMRLPTEDQLHEQLHQSHQRKPQWPKQRPDNAISYSWAHNTTLATLLRNASLLPLILVIIVPS